VTIPVDPIARQDGSRGSGGVLARLAVTVLAVGFWCRRVRASEVTTQRAGRSRRTGDLRDAEEEW
jgi:hypothetical protein